MRLIKSSNKTQVPICQLGTGQIGKIINGCFIDKIIVKTMKGYLCLDSFDYYNLSADTKIEIFPIGTKLEFEV